MKRMNYVPTRKDMTVFSSIWPIKIASPHCRVRPSSPVLYPLHRQSSLGSTLDDNRFEVEAEKEVPRTQGFATTSCAADGEEDMTIKIFLIFAFPALNVGLGE